MIILAQRCSSFLKVKVEVSVEKQVKQNNLQQIVYLTIFEGYAERSVPNLTMWSSYHIAGVFGLDVLEMPKCIYKLSPRICGNYAMDRSSTRTHHKAKYNNSSIVEGY